MLLNPVMVMNICLARFPARDRDRRSDRAAARSNARSTPANSCDAVASTDVVRSAMRLKLPSRVRGVEQQIHAPSGACDRDRTRGRSGMRLQAP